MTQHTPAPWEIVSGTYTGVKDDTICAIFGTESTETLKGVTTSYVTVIGRILELDDGHFDVDEEMKKRAKQQTANARLIAAAPELLEAAKSLIEVLTQLHFDGNLPKNHNGLKFARKQIKNAIARAECE